MQKYFFGRIDGRYVKINYSEIIYIEGCKNYIKIITDTKSHLILVTMKRMEEVLPIDLFRRIHKSFIVSIEKILEFDTDRVYLKNKELPIGQLYKNKLEKSIVIANEGDGRVVAIGISGNDNGQYTAAI